MTKASRRRLGGRVVAIALAALAAAAGRGEGAGELRLPIVDRAIEFHGGARYQASVSELELCSLSGCFRVRAQVDGGSFDLEAAGEVRGSERRVRITNDRVSMWESGGPAAVEAEREQRLRDWVMSRVYFCFLPFRLNDDSVFKQDLGLEVWEGRELHKVKVTFRPGSSSGADDEFLYWFDPATARLEQFAYSFSGNPGGVRFRRAFNYRRVGGLLFFDQVNLGIDQDGLRVDQITPELVSRMARISTVTLREIRVQPLESAPGR